MIDDHGKFIGSTGESLKYWCIAAMIFGTVSLVALYVGVLAGR